MFDRLPSALAGLALVLALTGSSLAQNPVIPEWPPEGWVLQGCVYVPPEVIRGDSVYSPVTWPSGVVRYAFDIGVTPSQQANVLRAMAEIEAISQVRFLSTAQFPGLDFIIIRENPNADNVSNSALGRVGGAQLLNVGSNHWTNKYILVHEFFHALGFHHEQQRADRDQYVSINFGNISQTACDGGPCDHNFDRVLLSFPVGPYDFRSIMHYAPDAFSNGNGPTIVAHPQYAAFQNQMGNLRSMTALDAQGIATVYGAPSRPTITSITPSTVVAGSPAITITIQGTGFFEGSPDSEGVQGSVARLALNDLATTWIDRNTLQAVIPASLLQTPGIRSLIVQNDIDAGWQSGPINFTVTYPPCSSQNDQVGYDVAGIGDVDGDRREDFVVGAPGLGLGGQVICRGGDGSVIWTANGFTGARFGQAVANAGDLDGDGIDDVIAGGPAWTGNQGYAQALSGVDGSVIRSFLATNLPTGVEFGYDVAGIGDLTGDGVPEILVGIPAQAPGGGMRVLSGATGSIVYAFAASQAGGRYGQRVAGGRDTTGDGVPDFVVGAPNYDGAGGIDSGRIVIYSGATGAGVANRDGDGPYDYLGRSVAMIEAPDGGPIAQTAAGAADFGSIFGSGAGRGYVRIYRGRGSFVVPGYLTRDTWYGSTVGDRFGQAVASAGDVDDDGVDDILLSASQAGVGASGRIGPGYVQLRSGRTGAILDSFDGMPGEDDFGWNVSTLGDVDRDGMIECLAGAPFADQPCPNAGSWRILEPRVAPAQTKVMITEVSTAEPQGVEIANFGDTAVNLDGWTLRWAPRGSRFPALAGLGRTVIQPGEVIVVKEPGGVIPELPLQARVLERFPNLLPTTLALSIALEDGRGRIRDEVRINDQNDQLNGPDLGGLWRGAVRNDATAIAGFFVAERAWGLDSNGGSDWRLSTVRSFGLENAGAGLRGVDGFGIPEVVINEIDVTARFIELKNRGGGRRGPVDLAGWSLTITTGRAGSPRVLRPFEDGLALGAGTHAVLGDALTAPSEMASPSRYRSLGGRLTGLGIGNDPFELVLKDNLGRVVDVVRFTGHDDDVVQNDPRDPSHWDAFTGYVARALAPQGILARNPDAPDSDQGRDFVGVATRTLGGRNQPAANHWPASEGRFDVRWNATAGGGGLTLVMNAGQDHAGALWSFFWNLGHLDGQGPIAGLGANAILNWQVTATTPPWFGALDDEGRARVDLPTGSLPPGLALDAIFVLQDPTGPLVARTGILEWDS